MTTQSSAKTESTSTTRSVAQTTSKEEVKEPMKTYEVGALLEATNQRDTKEGQGNFTRYYLSSG